METILRDFVKDFTWEGGGGGTVTQITRGVWGPLQNIFAFSEVDSKATFESNLRLEAEAPGPCIPT